MTPTNELEQLFLSSLKQILEEHAASMKACNERSDLLESQYASVLQQLSISRTHYEQVMQLLQSLSAALGLSLNDPSGNGNGSTGAGR